LLFFKTNGSNIRQNNRFFGFTCLFLGVSKTV